MLFTNIYSSVGKESACNAGDPGLIPGLVRSPGEGIGYPIQYSWASLVAHLVKNPPAVWETWVRSLGWEDPWRRERLPTPVLWPREFHGLYSPWGCKGSDINEPLSLSLYFPNDENLILIICCCLFAKLHLTLWDPMDCSPPGSSVHGILQARAPEWVAIYFIIRAAKYSCLIFLCKV